MDIYNYNEVCAKFFLKIINWFPVFIRGSSIHTQEHGDVPRSCLYNYEENKGVVPVSGI